MSEESLTIENCALCGGKHTYKLIVERALLIKCLTPEALQSGDNRAEFTRLFICPVKQDMYQATISLPTSGTGDIIDVKVVGISER